MKALVGAFNQEKALVGAFSVIVQLHRLIVYTALSRTHCCWDTEFLHLSVISIDLVLAADPLTVASAAKREANISLASLPASLTGVNPIQPKIRVIGAVSWPQRKWNDFNISQVPGMLSHFQFLNLLDTFYCLIILELWHRNNKRWKWRFIVYYNALLWVEIADQAQKVCCWWRVVAIMLSFIKGMSEFLEGEVYLICRKIILIHCQNPGICYLQVKRFKWGFSDILMNTTML